MKLAILGFMVAMVSAQEAINNATSASATIAAPSPAPSTAPTSVSACAVQST
jgi:hypothetical protein